VIERAGRSAYRSGIQLAARSPYAIGFAAQTTESEFSRDVSQSVHRVAERERVRLIAVNNDYSPKTALRNADQLIREGVNLVLEFQTYEHVAPIISSKFLDANIPVIAIEIPHPGAVYFGADNYQAGLIGGRALGRWAKENWDGNAEQVLLLELPIAGPLVGQGRTLLSLGKAAEAIAPLRKAIAVNAANEVSWFQLAQAQRALGNATEQQHALAEFQKLRNAKTPPAGSLSKREITKQTLDAKPNQ
jgi:ABC-type sugar transport system substrate-binding protein